MDKPPSTRSGTTPLTWPSVFALLINIASMSATMLNKTGDKGSPCLKPFLLQTLRMKGFSTRWISWVKSFIYGGSVAINVNNEIGPYFQTKLLVPLWGQGQGQLTKLLVPPCPHKATRVAVDLMVAKVPLVGSPLVLSTLWQTHVQVLRAWRRLEVHPPCTHRYSVYILVSSCHCYLLGRVFWSC